MNHREDTVGVAAPAPEAETPRRRRRWPWVLGAILGFLALAVALLGPFVIAAVARSSIERVADARGFDAAMGDVGFGWSTGLRIDGLSARERRPHGMQLAVEFIVIGPRWRDLVRGRLGFGRFRVVRPRLVLDTRRRPDPPPREKPPRPDRGDRPASEPDEPLALDLPLVVVDGVIEVCGRPGVPGFRVEDVDVKGRLYGAEQRFSGTITGQMLSGPLREAVRVEGDVALRGAGGRPEGRASFRCGGIDVGALAAFFVREGRPGIERGHVRADGELRAEGRHLAIESTLVATDLRVVTGRAVPAAIEEPSLTVTVRGRVFPGAERAEMKMEARATDLTLMAEGWVRGRKIGALDVSGSFSGRLERVAPFVKQLERLEGAGEGRFRVHGEAGRIDLEAGAKVTGVTAVSRPPDSGRGPTTVVTPEASIQVLLRRSADHPFEGKGVFQSAKMTLDRPELRLQDLRVAARIYPDRVEVDSATAKVNGGATSIQGRCDLTGDAPRFVLEAEGKDVDVTQTLAGLLAYVVPLYHVPVGLEAKLGGRLSGRCRLEGPGPFGGALDGNALAGTGEVQIAQGFVRGSALVAKMLTNLGGRDRYAFQRLETGFRLAKGVVHHEFFRAKGRDLAWGFKGSTGLDGRIDYRIDPGPLVERIYRRKQDRKKMRGWEKVLKETLGSLGTLPLAIRGTLDRPQFQLSAPKVSEMAPEETGKAAGKVIGGLLDDLLRRQKEREAKKREKKRRKKEREREEREKTEIERGETR